MAGPFGSIPASTPTPNPFGDLSRRLPGLNDINSSASAAIASRIAGDVSPGTRNAIQNSAAEWGAASGMPGFSPGSIGQNKALRNIGLTSEGQTTQGLNDYSRFIPTVSGTQTVNPALQAEISSHNNQLAAAPDPAAAASHAEQLFSKYQQMLSGGGGVGRFSPWGGGGTSSAEPSGNPAEGTVINWNAINSANAAQQQDAQRAAQFQNNPWQPVNSNMTGSGDTSSSPNQVQYYGAGLGPYNPNPYLNDPNQTD